jgi:hypothetical protein
MSDRSALLGVWWNRGDGTVGVASTMRRNDAMGAVAELAASQHGALTRRQAAALGLSPRQIRSLSALAMIDEPTPGVLRITASPVTWHQRLMIATLAGPGFWAGFRAAAHLHRIDGFASRCPRWSGPAHADGFEELTSSNIGSSHSNPAT